MADLSRATDARGQILLVTALILGITFVALALILNSAIFTENLASRGDTTGADDVVTYHHNLERGLGDVVAYETRNASSGETHDTVFGRIDTAVSDADAMLVRRHARNGVMSNATVGDVDNGTRIFQTNHSRNFTDGTGTENWTVASDVSGTRAFRMDVHGASATCSGVADCFTVNVSDGTDHWRVFVSETTAGEIEVQVDDGTDTESCGVVDEPQVPIDVTGGTVNGTNCGALAFSDAPGDGYDVRFENADAIAGTYSLVVDDESIATTPPIQFVSGSDPSVAAAVYELTLEYDFRSTEIVVGTELRVAPGEPDGR